MFTSNHHKKIGNFGLAIVLIASAIFIVSFSLINILKFRSFSQTSFGWAYMHIYPKLVMGVSPFNLFTLPEYSAVLIFSSPLNYLLAFIYRLFPRPEALLAFQNVFLASGALPVYLLTRKRLGSTYLAVAFSLAYLLHPIVTTGAVLGYIPLALGLPFLLFAFYYLEKGDFKKFIIFIILANLSKIDVVLMTLILGIILLFSKTRKRYGKVILKISFIWLIIAITACFIYLKSINRPFPVGMVHFVQYGDSITDALRYALLHPISIMKNMFNQGNMLIYAFSRLPNIFAFVAPLCLLPVIAEVGYILLRNQHSSGHFLILAFVFAGAIYGAERIIVLMHKAFFKYKNSKKLLYNLLATFILVPVLLQHYYVQPKSNFSENLGPLPFTRYFNFNYYKLTEHARIGHKLLKMIPDEASCLTLQSLASHIGKCRYVGVFAMEVIERGYIWDYVFVDLLKDDHYHIEKGDYFLKLKQFLTQDSYGVVAFEDGWLLLKKDYAQNRNKEALHFIEGLMSKDAYSVFEYFPLDEDVEYVYRHLEGSESNIVTVSIKNVQQIESGKQFDLLFQGEYNDRIQTRMLTSQGVMFCRNKHLVGEVPLKVIREFSPALLLIPSKLKENISFSTIQSIFDYGGKLINKEKIEAEISFIGKEEITVEAGKFKCLHFLVRHIYKDEFGRSKLMHIYNFWIAPKTGHVKTIHTYIPFIHAKYIRPEEKNIMNRYSSPFVETLELKEIVVKK